MIIKILLILAALGFGVLILRDSVPGHNLLRRIGGLVVVALAIVAVLWPTLTVYAANAVGVKRGTDLVLYAFVMVFLYSTAATSQRMHRLEHQVTVLTRELAIDRAGRSAGGPLPDRPARHNAGSGVKADG
jgi:hypothetical protein